MVNIWPSSNTNILLFANSTLSKKEVAFSQNHKRREFLQIPIPIPTHITRKHTKRTNLKCLQFKHHNLWHFLILPITWVVHFVIVSLPTANIFFHFTNWAITTVGKFMSLRRTKPSSLISSIRVIISRTFMFLFSHSTFRYITYFQIKNTEVFLSFFLSFPISWFLWVYLMVIVFFCLVNGFVLSRLWILCLCRQWGRHFHSKSRRECALCTSGTGTLCLLVMDLEKCCRWVLLSTHPYTSSLVFISLVSRLLSIKLIDVRLNLNSHYNNWAKNRAVCAENVWHLSTQVLNLPQLERVLHISIQPLNLFLLFWILFIEKLRVDSHTLLTLPKNHAAMSTVSSTKQKRMEILF